MHPNSCAFLSLAHHSLLHNWVILPYFGGNSSLQSYRKKLPNLMTSARILLFQKEKYYIPPLPYLVLLLTSFFPPEKRKVFHLHIYIIYIYHPKIRKSCGGIPSFCHSLPNSALHLDLLPEVGRNTCVDVRTSQWPIFEELSVAVRLATCQDEVSHGIHCILSPLAFSKSESRGRPFWRRTSTKRRGRRVYIDILNS